MPTMPSEYIENALNEHPAVFAVMYGAVDLSWRGSTLQLGNLQYAEGTVRLRLRRILENEYAVNYVRQALAPFVESGEVQWIEENETSTIRLGNNYAVRVKKSDRNGRTANIETARQLDMNQGLLFDEAPANDGEPIWLSFCYVPDEFDLDLSMIGLAFGDGRYSGLRVLNEATAQTLAQLSPQAWSILEDIRQRLAGG